MSFVTKIKARAYCRATEVQDRVVAAILNLYPEEFRESVELEATKVEGHAGDVILVFESVLKDKRGCETTLDYIFGKLQQQDHRRLHNSLPRRLDSRCIFFVRIDKQAAFLDDIVLAEDPDVISVKVHIRQYPRCKQEDARTMLEDRLRAASGDD